MTRTRPRWLGTGTAGRRVAAAVAVLGLVAIGVFGVLAPPEHCPSVTRDDLQAAAGRTVGWFERNQKADGTWLYLYEAGSDKVIPDYNVVRHAGAVMGLYQAARANFPGAQESADKGVDWLLDHTLARDDWTAITYQGDISTGSAALLIAGLSDRRALTGDHRYDDLMRRLGRFIAAQTEPSGAVLAYYDTVTDAPLPGEYSKYYTGESYWALARLHRTFPDEEWGELADRVGAYLATRRDDVEDNWPPIPDHWAAYGLSETVEFADRDAARPLTAAEEAYTRRQAEMFGSQVRWVSQRMGPWGIVVRTPHVPRGGGYGVVGEALTGFWRAAEADPRLADLRAPLAERARCLAGLAIEAQSDEDEAASYPEPGRVEGAWFRDGETRMDDQQHALAALLRTMAIVDANGADDAAGRAGTGGDMPSTWLWLVALVAALNPFRTVFGVPRAGHTERESTQVALLGGVAGGAVVLAVAWASGPLLDALDVSGPAIRLAAAIVAGVSGLVALFRRPLPAEPAFPGWRAALVPVAVPLIATPALLLLGMSAHSDRGFPVLLVALAIGIAALALITAFVPLAPVVPLAPATGAPTNPAAVPASAGPQGTVEVAANPAGVGSATEGPREGEASGAGRLGPVLVAWVGRLTAAALVASCVALAIDGVLAV